MSQSTAMVMSRRSVHLTTLFPGQAWLSGIQVFCAHTFSCNWQQPFLNASAKGNRMTVEIISWSISTKVWDRARIKLATPRYTVTHATVARHVTDCAMWHVMLCYDKSPWKYGTGPGSNLRPLDLQSDSLPFALWGPVDKSVDLKNWSSYFSTKI